MKRNIQRDLEIGAQCLLKRRNQSLLASATLGDPTEKSRGQRICIQACRGCTNKPKTPCSNHSNEGSPIYKRTSGNKMLSTVLSDFISVTPVAVLMKLAAWLYWKKYVFPWVKIFQFTVYISLH